MTEKYRIIVDGNQNEAGSCANRVVPVARAHPPKCKGL
jgi:hypothetical protein